MGIARLDEWFGSLYSRGRTGYLTLIGVSVALAIAFIGVSSFFVSSAPTVEALFGGSAGVAAFVAARATLLYGSYAERTARMPFRLKLGKARGRKVLGLAGAWLIALIFIGAQGIQHPAIGALTIMVALTLLTLVSRTRAEELAALSAEADEEIWSSEEQLNNADLDGDYEYEYYGEDSDEEYDEEYEYYQEDYDAPVKRPDSSNR